MPPGLKLWFVQLSSRNPLVRHMKQASFSVIVTCFNQSAFIRETIESVCNQTYPAKQIIVVDDASTDDSLRILEHYKDRISLISCHDNVGASAARNFGASSAEGDYLVFLDGDDVLQPWALEVYARVVVLKQPNVILCSLLYFRGPTVAGSSLYFRSLIPVTNHDAVPNEIGVIEYSRISDKDREYRTSASTMVVERWTLERVEGWTKGFFPCEDLDLILKLACCRPIIHIDFPPTVCYRMHAGNTMLKVPECAAGLCKVLTRATSGAYRKYGVSRFDAFTILGGPALFWLTVTLRSGHYDAASGVLFWGLPAIVVAACRRLVALVAGKRAPEMLPGLTDRKQSASSYLETV